jgi:hypothetical protein
MENEFQCAQCGAVYEVTTETVKRPVRDAPICVVCKNVMCDSNLVRRYRLTRAPTLKMSWY